MDFHGQHGDAISVSMSEVGTNTGFAPLLQIHGPDGQSEGASDSDIAATVKFTAPLTGTYTVLASRDDGNDGVGQYQITSSHAGTQASALEPPMSGKLIGNPAPCQSQTCGSSAGSPTPSSCADRPGCVQVGNPIAVGPGNKFEMVSDYETTGTDQLGFRRYYNSAVATGPATFASMLGGNWRGTYDRYLRIVSASAVLVERVDGRVLSFTSNGGAWTSDTDVDLKLTRTGSGVGSTWTLVDRTDTTETYSTISDSEAIVTTIQARNGYQQNLQYDAGNHLMSVVDSFGRTLQFAYQGGLLNTLTTPDGLVLTYGYDSSGVSAAADRLMSVGYSTSPATSQTYLYEDASFPFALTGIVDENGALRDLDVRFIGTSHIESACGRRGLHTS